MAAVRYHVEKKCPNNLGWTKVTFIESSNKAFCDGYVTAFDSMYPSDPYRIVKTDKDGNTKVVRETRGNGEVHLN